MDSGRVRRKNKGKGKKIDRVKERIENWMQRIGNC